MNTNPHRHEEAIRILIQANALLTAALDDERALQRFVEQTIPAFADYCTIHLIRPDGTTYPVALAHAQPELQDVMREMAAKYPPSPSRDTPVSRVMKTHKAVMGQTLQEADSRDLEAIAIQPTFAALFKGTSFMCVPMLVRDELVGVLSFVMTISERHYDEQDLEVAELLAQAAAMAVHNARLYQHMQRELHERERAEQEARRSADQLRLITDAIPALIAYVDSDYHYRFNSKGYETWFNSSADKFRSVPVRDVLGEERFNALLPYAQKALSGERVHFEDAVSSHNDGTMHYIESTYVPDIAQDGAVRGFFALITDITERKRADNRRALLQQVTAALSNAVTPADVAEVIVKTAVPLLGAQYGSVVLRTDDGTAVEAIDPEDIPSGVSRYFQRLPLDASTPVTDAVRTELPVWVETLQQYGLRYPELYEAVQHVTGSKALIALPLIVNKQAIGGIAISFTSEQAFTSDDRALLLAISQQCAQAIARARLFASEREARLAAEAADKLKLQFLGMVSHELRTPLASIKGFVSTLLAEDVQWDPVTQHEFLGIISEESDKLTNLVEQLLDLSRFQAGTLDITTQPSHFQDIIDTARAQFQILVRQHKLVVNCPPNLPPMMIDRQRMAQVLVNLVSNAAKFSPPATTIEIAARRAGAFNEVSVSDEGPGIAPEYHDVIFEAFRQIRGESRGSLRGAGLGLAICKAVVEAHGGRIWVQPSEQGTTIAFTVPIAE